jgi:predicted phage terminase large subunit-like protein
MGAKVENTGSAVKLDIQYHPAPIAKKFIEDSTFATAFFGPLGCGKTTAGVMKTWLYCQAWPGARIAIIRDTYPNLIDTTQKSFFEWLPEGVAGTYMKSQRTFYLNTQDPQKPAEIIFRAMDQKDDVSNILSLDLAAAMIDEPQGGLNLTSTNVVKEPGVDHELFMLLQARVGRQRGYHPMLWLTGNPPAPSHWIAKDFGYDGVGEPTNPNPDYHLYLGNQDVNRANLTPGYYERLERIFGRATPLARRFLDGEWIEFASINPFHKAWIKYWGTAEEPKPERLVVEIGFDPAISDKDTSAKSALVVAGQCRDGINRGRIYILEANAGHWSVYEQVDQIIAAAKRHKARAVRIEDVAYQRALKEVLEHELRARNLSLFVDLVKPDGDKVRRASGWSPWVEDGTILFHPDQHALIDCMISVPGDRMAWDLVDAAGICVRGFPALQSESQSLSPVSRIDRAASYTMEPLPNRKPQYRLQPNQKRDIKARVKTYFKAPLSGV